MRRVIIAAAMAALVSACQTASTTSTGPRPEQVEAARPRLEALKADRDARRLSWAEWARRTNAELRALAQAPITPGEEEIMAYRVVLAERVDRKQITPAEFTFEQAKAIRQLEDRNSANQVAALAAAPVVGPTTCVTNRIGVTTLTNCR
ncbi:hypothetical protein MKK69_22045 [Methylobacterium sp. J-026]|uniref:hypothetical protein n=1 Tax=Methylobacterium sp. J-026 TaxID=2836624 RepID=UPI001FBAE522|nr:hypothetical protein [Methylobacterium sp. J-026]MCJ2136697.1 hypothetical protein [Methylobacterium sp. J-026]